MKPVRWRQMTTPRYGEAESHVARYRRWTLYAGLWRERKVWLAETHRFVGGGAEGGRCPQVYPTLEGAQNAAEFYAEHGRWPHNDKVPA